jgi:hypothetical protein
MTDEVETQAPPDEGDKKPEKTYTQAEVDRLINLQKAKIKPLADQLESMQKGQSETLTAYETRINSLVEEMSKEVPASILVLLKKLLPIEQLDYLSDPANNVVFEKKQFPLSRAKAKGEPEFKPTPVEKFT